MPRRSCVAATRPLILRSTTRCSSHMAATTLLQTRLRLVRIATGANTLVEDCRCLTASLVPVTVHALCLSTPSGLKNSGTRLVPGVRLRRDPRLLTCILSGCSEARGRQLHRLSRRSRSRSRLRMSVSTACSDGSRAEPGSQGTLPTFDAGHHARPSRNRASELWQTRKPRVFLA